jgi:cell division protease FtsH
MSLTLEQQIKGDYVFDINTSLEQLEEIKVKLKSEFIGIDDEIDQLVDNIKPWMFFRNSLSKPHVITLVGLTGCGKTKLVDRLFDELKLKNILFKISGSKLNSERPLSPIANISLYNRCKTPIVFLDELQLYRSIDEDDLEIHDYNSEVWNFIDEGIVETCRGYDGISELGNSIWRIFCGLIYLKNKTYNKLSFSLNEEEVDKIRAVSEYDEDNESEKYNFITIKDQNISGFISEDMLTDLQKCCVITQKKVNKKLINTYTFGENIKLYLKDLFSIYNIEFNEDVEKYIINRSFEEAIEFFKLIKDYLLDSPRDPNLDYSKALIITALNLDEAYGIEKEYNPDISADELYKVSKKVNIVKIKEAMQQRFRSEQIARLGNSIVIYKSLSSKSYKTIISNQLSDYSEHIKNEFGVILEYDKTINNIIYKEGVYPVLGVRMVTSTINDMIKSTFASTLVHRNENNIKCDKILYKYSNNHIIANFYSGDKIIDTIKHKVAIRLDKLRNNLKDDTQALIGVHESGHALAEILIFSQVPIDVRSVTADTSALGFTFSGINSGTTIQNRQWIYNQVMVCLAGRAAEIIVFNNDVISNGATSDLHAANEYMFNAMRKYGLGDSLLIRQLSPVFDNVAKEYESDGIQYKVECKLKDLMYETIDLLETEKLLLLKLGEYLSNHASMTQKQLFNFVKQHAKTIDTSKLKMKYDNSIWNYRKQLETKILKEEEEDGNREQY